jgi:hypothetical protein
VILGRDERPATQETYLPAPGRLSDRLTPPGRSAADALEQRPLQLDRLACRVDGPLLGLPLLSCARTLATRFVQLRLCVAFRLLGFRPERLAGVSQLHERPLTR